MREQTIATAADFILRSEHYTNHQFAITLRLNNAELRDLGLHHSYSDSADRRAIDSMP